MRKKWVTAAFIIAVLGVAVSSLSLYEYFHFYKKGLGETSFCTINETVNCDIINASSYAKLMGIPTAAWGFLFYVVAACFILFVRKSKSSKDAAVAFIWVLSIAAFVWTFRMGYISLFILKAICLTCFAQYVLTFLLVLALSFAGTAPPVERFKSVFSKKVFYYGIVTAVIFGVGYVFALSAVRGTKAIAVTSDDIRAFSESYFRQSLYDIKPTDLNPISLWGNKDAKVTIVEFSDFQCPFCREAAFQIKPYLYEFRDKVKFVFMNYPLDKTCNKYVQNQMHANACLAAKAAMCAGEKDEFWNYHDDVFRNQQNISKDLLLKLAEKRGIEKDRFEQCIDSEETLQRVKDDIEVANHIYISGTPSIFINQRQFRGWHSPEVLRKIIEEELKRAK